MEQNQAPEFLKVLAHDLRWQLLTKLSRSDYRVQELVDFLGHPQNLVSYHLKRLRDVHLIMERRSTADGRDFYYSLDLERLRDLYLSTADALHPILQSELSVPASTLPQSGQRAPRILFLCTENSARSQMAEAILRHLSHGWIEVASAGTQPAPIHSLAFRAMEALHISMKGQESKRLDRFQGQSFTAVVTVCDRVREACPEFPEPAEQIHWSLPDPVLVKGSAEEQYHAFAETARQLLIRCRHLLTLIAHEQGYALGAKRF